MHRIASLIALVGLASGAPAFAQSYNVDINVTSGNGAGAPAASFGAGAQQPGFWNSVTSASPTTMALTDTTGVVSGVTLTRSLNGAIAGASIPATSGEYAKLFDDAQETTSFESMTFTFNNLPFGDYLLYTYAGNGAFADPSVVRVTASDGIDDQSVEGGASNELVPGVAYGVHGKTVFAGGSLTVVVMPAIGQASARVSGFQLKKVSGRTLLHVDKGASGNTQDGSTWLKAFPDLQHALLAAQMGGGKHFEIWAASGFYRPTSGTSRAAKFVVPDGLRLFGGFNGSESSLTERNAWAINITAMSGAIGGSATTDNSYTVCDASGATAGTLIDGWTIASGRNSDNGRGGGLRIVGGSPVVRNCKIIGNESASYGAGAYVEDGSPLFVNVLFYNNDCYNGQGGGAYLSGQGASGVPTFVSCEFTGNYAVGDGGAITLSNSPAKFHNGLFSGNTSSFNAGALYATGEASDFEATNCTFSGNASFNGVGGLNFRSGADAEINSSIFWGNIGAGFMTTEEQQVERDSNAATTLVIRHTTVEGYATLAGTACNGLNPAFVDANGADNTIGTTDDDCRLLASSPLIDAGNNAELPSDVGDVDGDNNVFETLPLDLAFGLRRVESGAHANTGSGSAPLVDRGAYEFVPSCPGDTNGDAVVNFIDLNQVLSDYGQNGFGLEGDVNNDQQVNFLDLNIVLSTFGSQC